jgi:hypothetical protein
LGIVIQTTITIFPNTFRYFDNDINISLAILIFRLFLKYLDICTICQYFSNNYFNVSQKKDPALWNRVKLQRTVPNNCAKCYFGHQNNSLTVVDKPHTLQLPNLRCLEAHIHRQLYRVSNKLRYNRVKVRSSVNIGRTEL